ncbi:uncharacterized protein BJ171DRAFT_491612 [Polychytrium aggregatum]|uniref:uncharacterized protein n=1 Tax=Polychytrium aggregatum TaxID=110093 RepID=UPI0022FE5F84|nr:uncharacterized protein BJ171DRAFT_491612 [Polychytrium aggregatum]KAI9207823.1 hypothetical protein BJ171DRAFT_491612 [Polychytrium aggregatum]
MSRPRATKVNSVSITLCQDIFNEISNLIGPIAQRLALDTKIGDQHISKDLMLLGKKELASANNIKIETFNIKLVEMPIQDGFILVKIREVDVDVSLDLEAVGASLGKVWIDIDLNIDAKVRFSETDGKLKTDVFDVAINIANFDAKIGSGFTGKILSTAIDFVENVVKSQISSALTQPIDEALTSGLDSVLGRDLDVAGNVSTVFYRLNVDFNGNPVITAAKGVEIFVAIDSVVSKDGPIGGAPAAAGTPGPTPMSP